VHDAVHARRPEPLAQAGGLGSTERAQLEAVEVAVEDPIRVLDVRVPDQIETSQFL
jgi:hypothetical protein